MYIINLVSFIPCKVHLITFMENVLFNYCTVPENIHNPPTEGIGIFWGVGGFVRPKNLKKCMKLNWNFQRGGVLEKITFTGLEINARKLTKC